MPCKILHYASSLFHLMARAVQYRAFIVCLEENSNTPLPMFLGFFLVKTFWGITEKESFLR